MDQTLLVEAGKQGFVFVIMSVGMLALAWLARQLWNELREERAARSTLTERVITVTLENTAALRSLEAAIRGRQ